MRRRCQPLDGLGQPGPVAAGYSAQGRLGQQGSRDEKEFNRNDGKKLKQQAPAALAARSPEHSAILRASPRVGKSLV
jgi:hypothetical protein